LYLRQAAGHPKPVRDYVLYWAQASRRVESNRALALAAEMANELDLPLLFYEELRSSDPYASDRFHRFVLEGVAETERRAAALGIGYTFYLQRRRSDPASMAGELAARAAAVVTDDYPFSAAPEGWRRVDSSCMVPASLLPRREYAAYTMRPKIHKLLPEYLRPVPRIALRRPFRGAAQFHTRVTSENIADLIGACEIDHTVPPAASVTGGRLAAEKQLAHFLKHNLRRYAAQRNQPTAHATSGLSPYLHFGHISSLEVALAVRSYARAHKLIASEFLEELIVRRELAFNFAHRAARVDSLEVLPEWARDTMRRHRRDRRDPAYRREQFEQAATHDALWNATQHELLKRGTIHGYYRMYWGKKIIEWSPSYEEALGAMIYLHDRYALDGRDPNTYANILWCFGLHDRPWPERPIFGTLRSMSLEGMRRKTDVDAYIREIVQ
jgi:deoxyribodipyrimidine photo-lyase